MLKTRRKSSLLILALSAALADVQAQKDSPPLNPDSVSTELARLKTINTESLEDLRRKALATLNLAVANGNAAARLYERAVEETISTDFPSWKKGNAQLLRDKTFQDSLLMRWRYLLLSLESGRSEDRARWAEPSLKYARNLADLLTAKSHRQAPQPSKEVLLLPLRQGPVVRWLRLEPLLADANQWEQVPGDLSGILEKNVRVPWRAVGDSRLETTWELELGAGAALAEGDSPRAIEDFNTVVAPALYFRRALDREAAGQPHRASADILELARRYPSHPGFSEWVEAISRILKSGGKATSGDSSAP